MLNQTSTTAIARIVLLAGILLALAFLASRSFFPAFAQEEIEFPENGTDPVVAFAATDEDGDTVSWGLDGTDEADFSITNGVLAFKSPPDYENPTDRDTADGFARKVPFHPKSRNSTRKVSGTVTLEQGSTLTDWQRRTRGGQEVGVPVYLHLVARVRVVASAACATSHPVPGSVQTLMPLGISDSRMGNY